MSYPKKVYVLRHNLTGKVYVGSSENVPARIKSHLLALRSGKHINKNMQSDFDKYGDDYSFFVVDMICDVSESRREYWWMEVMNSRDPQVGYNNEDRAPTFSLDEFDEHHVPKVFAETEFSAKPRKNGNLKALRKSKGFTQSFVANRLDIDQSALSKWESGYSKPLPKYQRKLAALFECDVSELTAEWAN